MLRFEHGERELCLSLQKFFAEGGRRAPIGIGDDAAVLATSERTAVTVDPVVEGVHFDADAPLHLVGQKAVRRNLSDLAAMGARADHLLVSVLFPPTCDVAGRMALFRGIRRASRHAGASVVGGDVGSTPGPLTVTITALGKAPKQPLRRDRLSVGQSLHCTGALGGSRLGRHLRFEPRLAEGAWLARQDGVLAAMDVSDGLLLDLATMLRASGGLGATLEVAALPVHADARRIARQSRKTPLWHALQDGEDHELLFGLRRGRQLGRGGPLTMRARRPFGLVTKEPGIFLCWPDGRQQDAFELVGKDGGGYQHGL